MEHGMGKKCQGDVTVAVYTILIIRGTWAYLFVAY